MESFNSDVLIVGAGLAGIYTALMIDASKEVIILVKEDLPDTNSRLAQGGIAGELEINEPQIKAHIKDTLSAGSHINDIDAVHVLVTEAKENIQQLMALNVQFDTDDDGNILLTKEGGHSTRRILHVGGDSTGNDIMTVLRKECKRRENIRIIENAMAIDLLHQSNTVTGLIALHKGEFVQFTSPNVVLATGGIGNVYGSTTNSTSATGDGIGMALRAGVTVEDMAFVQFHPTAFHNLHKTYRQKFLISEAVRGEGAVLRNSEHERFMEKYDDRLELAPRDTVSQAIFREMYDTWTDHVFLDATDLDCAFLKHRFPTIYSHLKDNDYDLCTDLIPVSPVQHFAVGGILADVWGRTSMKHLYATGECAKTGVHGANRLASNSLLECVVFGGRIAKHINAKTVLEVKNNALETKIPTRNYNYIPMKQKLAMLMDEYVGIVRKKEGLLKAQTEVLSMENNLLKHQNKSKYYYEALNMVQTSKSIIIDALNKTQSIGCHYRIDGQ